MDDWIAIVLSFAAVGVPLGLVWLLTGQRRRRRPPGGENR